jgi:hypothetical protein
LSSPSITVRYDAQNAEAVVSANQKIVKSLDSLRTSTGSITSSVKQMETGFRADVFGSFGNSVAAADTKVTSFRTKLQAIGQQFGQNATSFGVATASIWGVYNAYDSLEKVQIRAHAAATRVSTLETTIATLTQRRAQAVEKGNVSAEQMAILDDRITNAHNKLAVAQERNADLQQDVTEAWAGFLSQVGPQSVAAIGSIVQLVTNLRGSFGGVIPAIRGFFSSIGGGTPVISQVNNAALASAPIFRNMAVAEDTAKVATTGLSASVKGLLISTGIGAIAVGIGFLIEALMRMSDASAQTAAETNKSFNDMAAGPDAYLEETTATMKEAQAVIDAHTQAIENAVNKQSSIYLRGLRERVQAERDEEARSRAVIATKIASLSSYYAALQKQYDSQGALINQWQGMDEKMNKVKSDLDEQVALYNKSASVIATYDKNLKSLTEQYDEAIAREKAAVASSKLLLDQQSGASTQLRTIIEQNKQRMDDWVRSMVRSGKTEEEIKLAAPDFIKANFGVAGSLDFQKIASEELNVILAKLLPSSKDVAKAMEDEKKAVEQANEEWIRHGEEIVQRVKEKNLELDAEQKLVDTLASGINVRTQSEKITEAQVSIAQKQKDSILENNKALAEQAIKYGVNTAWVAKLISDTKDYTDELNQIIAANVNWNEALNDSTIKLETIHAGQAQATTGMKDWVTGLVKGQAEADRTRVLVDSLAKSLGIDMTQAAHMTTEELKNLIAKGFMGATDAAVEFERQLSTTIHTARDFFSQLTGADTMKDFNKQWKEMDFGKLGKGALKDIKDFFKTIHDNKDSGKEMATDINLIISSIGVLGDKLKDSTIHKAAENIIKQFKGFKGVSDEAKQGMNDLFEPMTKLKGVALDGYIQKTAAAMQKYVEVTADGVFSAQDYRDVQALLPDDLKKGGDAADTAKDQYAGLDETQTKIAENNILARTINQITIDLNLQGRAVRGLTTDFGNLVDIMKQMQALKGGGGNGKGGFSNVVYETGTTVNTPESPESHKTVLPNGTVVDDSQLQDKTVTITFKAVATQFIQVADAVLKRVQFIDALRPIVDFLGDHRAFMKAAIDVFNRQAAIDKLRPIVEFLGDHRAFMKAAIDVFQRQAAIDKLRPIVDFLGDHRQFMKAASDVEAKVKQIDGMVATVTIKAKRVGNFTAQHGMHATLADDAFIYAHKGERVDIAPPHEQERGAMHLTNNTSTMISSPKTIFLEMPVYLFPGAGMLTKIIKQIPLEDTGMYSAA